MVNESYQSQQVKEHFSQCMHSFSGCLCTYFSHLADSLRGKADQYEHEFEGDNYPVDVMRGVQYENQTIERRYRK